MLMPQRAACRAQLRAAKGVQYRYTRSTKLMQSMASMCSWVGNLMIDFSRCKDTDIQPDDLQLKTNVITEEEERVISEECLRYLQRRRYERDHWDQVIVDFKEMERSKWSAESREILDKVRGLSIFPSEVEYFDAVHVIDLAESGYIKPHIDSVKFSGRVVAGLSLLSPCIMQFAQENNIIDVLLPRRSLYLMTGRIRYEYTHQVLPGLQIFKGEQPVHRTKRVSIIFRDHIKEKSI